MLELDSSLEKHLKLLRGRYLEAQGGFALQSGGGYRPDATAWAVLACRALGDETDMIAAAQHRLAKDQLADGRICLSPYSPEACWPTALSVLAWQKSSNYQEAQRRGVQYLLSTTGLHGRRNPEKVVGHDASLKGWPWIARTHSWVEPTAITLIALKLAGYQHHARTREAVAMLLDRQLLGGGWNYGNTRVFGRELAPYLHSTGLALTALKDLVERQKVEKSLSYLQDGVFRVRTPLSLGWGLLGLTAWGERPPDSRKWMEESLNRQGRYGFYNTCWLSLLLVAAAAPEGLASIL